MRHIRLGETPSTNDDARRAFDNGEALPCLFSARRQTSGRGRGARAWFHHPGNFAGTYLFEARPPLRAEPGLVSLLSSLAVRDSLIAEGMAPESLALKWPNDVLFAERKVAGILAEYLHDGSRHAFAIGIGVNLAAAPSDTTFPAASLFSEAQAPDPAGYGERLGARLLHWVGVAEGEGGAQEVFHAWQAAAWRFGDRVTVRGEGGGDLRGVFTALDEHGR
ncbi:MAG: biotin--[acetyl-CoA-carboxylase] ligase, partial [Parvularcula sp.]|nr:biotin--[acetyl-CoA-carboxylase] ligase [Parvularcula sp.]